jgi:hypothetical protein
MPPQGGIRTSLQFRVTQALGGSFAGSGVFSPGQPLVPPDVQPVRVYDFAVGENTTITPRAREPFGFAHLRAFANVELVRLAIETRKDQIERLDWRVKPKDERKPKRGAEGRVETAQALLVKPDGVTPFRTWMRMLLEELLVLDAPAIERRRTLGGALRTLDVVPGDTIKPLIDDTGRRPTAPDPAFQQIIKGRVWANLTDQDLIYAPRNRRASHAYGFGPVEQIIVTINTVLQRQTRQLAWFSDGNTPPGVMSAPEGWTPDNIKDYQEWFDAKLRGNTAARSGIIWGPYGAKYSPFKDPPLKDDFDEWLARIVAFAFNLPPTPFIKQMNRATADNDGERALEEGREPLMLWAKQVLDSVIQDDLGFTDLEFHWEVARDIDPKVQNEIDDRDLKNGSKTLDEIRDARGMDPYPNGIGSKPLIYTATGPLLLEVAITEPPKGDAEAGPGEAEASDDQPEEDKATQ